MLTHLQNIGDHEQILAHVEKLSINKNSLKSVTNDHEELNSKIQTDIYYLTENQAKLLYLSKMHFNEVARINFSASMLEPYYPAGDDAKKSEDYEKSARIAARTMWKSLKDELKVKLPWVGENFKSLVLCKGNKVAISHIYIPAHVRENEALSLIPQKPAYLN